jgi:hypothetical protein
MPRLLRKSAWAALSPGNGSILFPAKIPDLIGIKDRKYIDHTATHLHRGIGDLMLCSPSKLRRDHRLRPASYACA